MPAGHLVVSRIGEGLSIRDMRHAALVLVAENLSLLCDHSPQEREEYLSTFRHIVTPEFFAQGVGGGPTPARFRVQQAWVRACENFLPPQPVTDNQNHMLGLLLGRRESGKKDQEHVRRDRPNEGAHSISPFKSAIADVETIVLNIFPEGPQH